MGFLSKILLEDDPFTMNTATVSLWFRLPSASMETAVARDLEVSVPGSFYSTLRCAVPLLMWGDQVPADAYSHGPIGPNYIAIDGDNLNNPQNGGVDVENGLILSLVPDTTYSAPTAGGSYDGFVPQFGGTRVQHVSRPPITLDAWHHLFLSWTLAETESVTSMDGGSEASGLSTLYYILDGVNKTGFNRPCVYDEAFPDVNSMMTDAGYALYNIANTDLGSGSASIPKLSTSPLVIPGREVFGEKEGTDRSNLKVQLGPLQVFGGLMLTPSNLGLFVNNRRPTNPSAAETALGVTPHVRISTDEEWASGTNTGTLGNFTVTGTINTYVPPGVIEYA